MAIECQKPVFIKPEPQEAVGVETVLSQAEIAEIFGGSVLPVKMPLKTEMEEILDGGDGDGGEEIDWEKEEKTQIAIEIRPEEKGEGQSGATPTVKIWGEITEIAEDEKGRLVLTVEGTKEPKQPRVKNGEGDEAIGFICVGLIIAGGVVILVLRQKRSSGRLHW